MKDDRDAPSRSHFDLLETLYAQAPITRLYGTDLAVERGRAVVTLPVDPRFFHAARALHGSAYFRALDDAAFFAANSVVPEHLVLTSSFRVDFFRPVSSGILRSVGALLHEGRSRLVARSELYDDAEELIAVGVGTFIRSRHPLRDLLSPEGGRTEP